MFTQCPNCNEAFRVNAGVLKQAAGKVRCGGCGVAFDAVPFLTEIRPQSRSTDEKAALLRTLDDLAGPDVQLEDTGVEWRLLAEDGEEFEDDSSDIFISTDTPVDAELSADSGAARIDELLDDSPAPIDELLMATPNRIDESEVFADGDTEKELDDEFDLSASDIDDGFRFDDDTGVPEASEPDGTAAPTSETRTDERSGPDTSIDDANDVPADLAFGDADEWGELLDEMATDDAADDEESEMQEDEYVPELHVQTQSDEEQTMDRMIDDDLMSLATESDDGGAATVTLAQQLSSGKALYASEEESWGVETIIMEGDSVRSLQEQEKLDALADSGDDAANTNFIAAAKRTMSRRFVPSDDSEHSTNWSAIVGIAALALLLVGQALHQSRAELATIPAVGSVITPIYRAIGAPVTPDWDVRGWRFEVTRGSTNSSGTPSGQRSSDTGAEVLTIYSRIRNQSSKPLAYPLISVSLTDRFEEIIGSKVLEPGDYLVDKSDPERLVRAAHTFNAVIAIQSPPDDATGFTLNVCYRQADGMLRCAIEDFR